MFSVLKPSNFWSILVFGLLSISAGRAQSSLPTRWAEAPFTVASPAVKTFKTADMGHVFKGQKNCIVRVPAELNGLTGVQTATGQPLTLTFNQPVKVLIGVFRDTTRQHQPMPFPNQKPVLMSGLTVTGLPRVDVYALPYGRGSQVIQPTTEPFIIVGVVKASQAMAFRDAGFPDGRHWEPYVVEGFSDEEALFEIIGGPDTPVVAQGMPGTEGIQGGFEGGCLCKDRQDLPHVPHRTGGRNRYACLLRPY